MFRFKFTTVGGEEEPKITSTDAEDVLKAMQGRPTWEGVIVTPDEELGLDGAGQFPLLNLSWYAGYGYEVQCFESAKNFDSDFLVISESLSRPEVYVELGGQGQELWPRELFVPFSVAAQATKYLLDFGQEDLSLVWVSIKKIPRLAVSRRR